MAERFLTLIVGLVIFYAVLWTMDKVLPLLPAEPWRPSFETPASNEKIPPGY